MDEILTSDVIGQAFLSEEVDRARQEIKSLSSLSDKCKSTLKVRLRRVTTAATCSADPHLLRRASTSFSTN